LIAEESQGGAIGVKREARRGTRNGE